MTARCRDARTPGVAKAYSASTPMRPCSSEWTDPTGDAMYTTPPINSALTPGPMASYRSWNVGWSSRSPCSSGGTARRAAGRPDQSAVGCVAPTSLTSRAHALPGPRLTTVIGSNGNSVISSRSESTVTACSVAMSVSRLRYRLL